MSKMRTLAMAVISSVTALSGNVQSKQQHTNSEKTDHKQVEVAIDTLSHAKILSDTIDSTSEFRGKEQSTDKDLNQKESDAKLIKLYQQNPEAFDRDIEKINMLCLAFDRNINQLNPQMAYHLLENNSDAVQKMKKATQVMNLAVGNALQCPENLSDSQKKVISECVRYIVQSEDPEALKIYAKIKIAALAVMNELIKTGQRDDEIYIGNVKWTSKQLQASNSFFTAQFREILKDRKCQEKFGEKPVPLKNGKYQNITSLILLRYYLQYKAIREYKAQEKLFYMQKLGPESVFYEYFHNRKLTNSNNRKKKKEALKNMDQFERECYRAFGIDISEKHFINDYAHPEEEFEFLRKLEIEDQKRERSLKDTTNVAQQNVLLTAKNKNQNRC